MKHNSRLGWWQQLKVDIVSGIPFMQAPNVDAGTEEGDELTREEEEQFAEMVASLGSLFPFVRPSPAFRARLKNALLAEQRQRLAYRAAVPAPQEGSISWRWPLAATVPLLIGVLATILWRRSHRSGEQLVSSLGGQ